MGTLDEEGRAGLTLCGHRGDQSQVESRSPEWVHERAVPGDIPHSEPRPRPAACFRSPLEVFAAELARVRQLEDLATGGVTVAPDDLAEPQRERPRHASLCHDLSRGR